MPVFCSTLILIIIAGDRYRTIVYSGSQQLMPRHVFLIAPTVLGKYFIHSFHSKHMLFLGYQKFLGDSDIKLFFNLQCITLACLKRQTSVLNGKSSFLGCLLAKIWCVSRSSQGPSMLFNSAFNLQLSIFALFDIKCQNWSKLWKLRGFI